jgi:hypothetical protein
LQKPAWYIPVSQALFFFIFQLMKGPQTKEELGEASSRLVDACEFWVGNDRNAPGADGSKTLFGRACSLPFIQNVD